MYWITIGTTHHLHGNTATVDLKLMLKIIIHHAEKTQKIENPIHIKLSKQLAC